MTYITAASAALLTFGPVGALYKGSHLYAVSCCDSFLTHTLTDDPSADEGHAAKYVRIASIFILTQLAKVGTIPEFSNGINLIVFA